MAQRPRQQEGDREISHGGVCVWRVSFYNNKSSISCNDRVSSVINHVLRSQPHQGLGTQETGTLERYHTPKGPAPRGGRGGAAGAGVQASFAPERMHARTRAPGPFLELPDVRLQKRALSKSVNESVGSSRSKGWLHVDKCQAGKKCDFRCRSSLVANCLITPELKARLVAQSADKRVGSRDDLKESGRSVFSSPVMQLDGSFACALM